ncbi:TetR/AcrR family transcriptional regulator [Streptomyces sp. NPDC048179]|uniref:TetR/AcrR family transcriptional regulator n=1 Tax=Streptomyces sp. NPDC048179 TaxID=3365506 RepID=UPI003719EEE8
MPTQSRPLRADAARNAQRIIEAAHAVFDRGGYDVPMDEIAAEAGVGIATLYRRFPSRENLVKAVLEHRLAVRLSSVLEEIRNEPNARRALRLALEAGVSAAAKERGTLAAASNVGAMTLDIAQRFFEPASRLIERGQYEGVVRSDLVADDVPRIVLMLVGTFPSFEPGSDGWRRYLDLLMDAIAPSNTPSRLTPPQSVLNHSPSVVPQDHRRA